MAAGTDRGFEISWRRVLARDERFDGAFVFAVRSTGVYCRPSCPSRRPGRRQVVFFRSPQEAERAGFRPCLRCKPRSASGPAVETIRRAAALIEASEKSPKLAEVAASVGASPTHLARLFRRVVGVTPREYAAARRAGKLRRHLKEARNVTEAIYEAGYSSSSRVYERANRLLGMTPAEYRAGGRGARIRYAVIASKFGKLLLAATERGICRVMLGDSERWLLSELHSEFPSAEISRGGRELARWAQLALGRVEAGGPSPNGLPLDIRGTAFQWKVWKALERIPRGRTRTYGEIARAIGEPSAARAVGSACGSNPVALIIPCHRAVPAGDKASVGGYRWGTERKKALLRAEQSAPKSQSRR